MAPDGETYLNLAKVLGKKGRIAEAKQAAQQALDKGVKNPDDAKKLAGEVIRTRRNGGSWLVIAMTIGISLEVPAAAHRRRAPTHIRGARRPSQT